jgi:hypothetical protein
MKLAQGSKLMNRFGHLVSAFLIGIALSASSVQAQQYKYIGKISFPAGTPEYVGMPYSLAIDNDGTIYVGALGEKFQHPWPLNPIRVFTPDGKFIRSFGVTATGQGLGKESFDNAPSSIKIGKNGFVYVADQNRTIKVFDKSGVWVRNLGGEGTSTGFWWRTAFEVEDDGSVWNFGSIYEAGRPYDIIHHISVDGSLLSTLKGAQDNWVGDVTKFSNDTFLLAGQSKVIEISRTMNPVKESSSGYLSFLWKIKRKANGTFVALDWDQRKIVDIDSTGKVISTFDLTQQIESPNIVSYDLAPHGSKIFVADTTTNQLLIWDEANPPVVTTTIVGSSSTPEWFPNGFTLISTASDDYTVAAQRITVNNSSTDYPGASKELTFTAEGSYTIKVSALDEAGNRSEEKTIQAGIDRTKPSTTATVSNGGLVVTLNATDATSGVKATYYSINGGPVQEYKDLIVVPVGNNPVTYWSVDNAGNREDPKVVTPEGSNNQTSQITSFKIDKSSSLGGPSRSLTIEIKAQSTSTTINIASDNPNVIVPASITIDAGQTTKTFSIETKPVGGYTQTNITATLGTQSRLAQLDLLPPTAKIRISPPVVTSESTAKATITLSGNAPFGGLVVDLESDETAASVPSSITVPEGLKTATFNIATGKVTEETYAYISATVDGVSSEASLTIRPKSIKPTSLSITESLVGGTTGTGTITLSDAAPLGGLDIDLATNNAAVSLPLVVKVAEGSKTATFSFTTLAVSSTITATVSAKANGATVTDTIEVKVKPLGTLVANPSTLPGKSTGTATLTLASPTATPLTVSVSSSNPAGVLASKTITIAKGQSSGIIKFTTALVSSDTTSTIVCSANGLEAKTDITVQAARPSSVVLLPSVVLGGKSSLGTVTISSAAPVSGLTVALRSSDSSAVVPSFVLVPSGKTTATFTITTSKVTASKNVVITASANGTEKTASLGVRILTIASISFNPSSIEGGGKANGLLTLTDVAPLGGMTVALSSDKAGVTVPTTLLVPAGKSTVAFVANTLVTGSSYDATITGTANLETGSGKLKLLAPAVSSFTLSSTSVKGGSLPLGTVKIAKVSSVDVVVSLSSSNASVASVPATVTIPKGQLLATFQVTTTKPSVASSVTLSATTGGLAKTVVLKVSP